jgi:hypothetical protein
MTSFISKIVDKISKFSLDNANKKDTNDILDNFLQLINEIQDKLDKIDKTNISIYKIKRCNIENYGNNYDIFNSDTLLDILLFQSNISHEMNNLSITDPDNFISLCKNISDIAKFYNESYVLLCDIAKNTQHINFIKQIRIPDFNERKQQIVKECSDLCVMIYSLKITSQIYMMCREFPNHLKIDLLQTRSGFFSRGNWF